MSKYQLNFFCAYSKELYLIFRLFISNEKKHEFLSAPINKIIYRDVIGDEWIRPVWVHFSWNEDGDQ